MNGRTLSPGQVISAGTLLYLVLTPLIFVVFYVSQPFDRDTGEGATTFRAWFWVTFAAHLILPLVACALLARAGRAHLLSVVGFGILIATASWVTLYLLSSVNTCIGMSDFPLGVGNRCG